MSTPPWPNVPMAPWTSPFQCERDRPPDSNFEPGRLEWLVPGNAGRRLDYRRTPVRIAEVREHSGLIILEVLAFEDAGNTWEVPFEWVHRFQFARGSARVDPAHTARYHRVAERMSRPLRIDGDERARHETLRALTAAEADASHWIRTHAPCVGTGLRVDFTQPDGEPALFDVLAHYMAHWDLVDHECRFAGDHACKFQYSEHVRAQRIAMAELGLVSYDGTILREEAALSGRFSLARRQEYTVRRMAFVRSLYGALGIDRILVYRGLHCASLPTPPPCRTFVSATTNRTIAEALACFDEPTNENRPGLNVGVLMSQQVPVRRVFMTYMETPQMNHPYKESELLLLHEAEAAF